MKNVWAFCWGALIGGQCCKNYFGTRKVVKRFFLRCDLKEIQDKLCLPLRVLSAMQVSRSAREK